MPWESPGSPQGTPRNRLRGLRGCARLPPAERASVLGWAKNSRGMAGQGQPVGGSWGGAGRGHRVAAWAQDRPSMALAHPPCSRWPASHGPADRLFFPCLTKYGQGAQPEGATWPAACLGCLAGYIRTAKVRPAPDTRGAPTPAPALRSALLFLPSPAFVQV